MMKYFQIVTATSFKWVGLIEDDLYEKFATIEKPFVKCEMKDVRVKHINLDSRSNLRKGDVSWFSGGGIVLAEKAAQALKSVLFASELVSMLDANMERLFYVNPPHINCISLGDSEYLPCPMTGQPLIFSKIVLRAVTVAPHPIMRLPGRRPGTVFVRSDFVEIFSEHALKGIDFEQVEVK